MIIKLKNISKEHVGLLLVICLELSPLKAVALQKTTISNREFILLPPYCQTSDHLNLTHPPNFNPPTIREKDRIFFWHIGIWHYCTGYIKTVRAERHRGSKYAKQLLESEHGGQAGIDDLLYSYTRIEDNKRLLAAEMAVTIARAYIAIENFGEAKKYLNAAISHDNYYSGSYFFLAKIYNEKNEYSKAIDIINSAPTHVLSESAELLYLLGVSYLKVGDINAARMYADRCYALGYPLNWLKDELSKIKEAE